MASTQALSWPLDLFFKRATEVFKIPRDQRKSPLIFASLHSQQPFGNQVILIAELRLGVEIERIKSAERGTCKISLFSTELEAAFDKASTVIDHNCRFK